MAYTKKAEVSAAERVDRLAADQLVISTRTVQNHIRNIYDKIDARNRSEATAFALNHLCAPE